MNEARGDACPAGCDEELEPMARWAPYRTCPTCGTGFWIPPRQPTYWEQGTEPNTAQHDAWSGRDAQRIATIGWGPGRLLDVGCGFGHFVRWATEHGWDAWGVERDPWARAATVAAGRVVAGESDLDASFDVVTLWDVLEHTVDPIGLAAGLRSLIRPGGRLFVCSPNFAAMKLRWPYLRLSPRRFSEVIKPHEHATQFTDRGLDLTLRRAGFSRVEFLHPPLASRPTVLFDAVVRRWQSLRLGLFVNGYAP